ncbi:hypothetical protein K2173_015216 [Erythroxylum novogranatense]|uniref:Uncharacterized protein n=1 Tax=Erythroxylum novogranatense TaxID=1862640 RepID=A0AAV8T2D8_9ROSI|nr:hypothetical protein K2173_015216 [Erythroxylum novogranatense]
MRENNLVDDEKVIRDFVAPMPTTHPSSELQSFGKDSGLQMDKRVIEHELPELKVCYEENTNHVIKDICVDEGVPSQDKVLFDTDVEKNVCTILRPGKDRDGGMSHESHGTEESFPDWEKCAAEKENRYLHLPVADARKSSEEKGFINQLSRKLEPENLILREGVRDDSMEKLTNLTIKGAFSLKDLLSIAQFGEELSRSKSSKSSTVEIEELHSVQMPSGNVLVPPFSAHEKYENDGEGRIPIQVVSTAEDTDYSQEAFLTTALVGTAIDRSDLSQDKTTLDAALESTDTGGKSRKPTSHAFKSVTEESPSRMVDEVPCDSKLGTRSITHDFGSFATRASSSEGCLQNVDHDHPQIQYSSYSCRLEDSNAKPLSSQFQYNVGESSFSSACPPSGLITYSGPIVGSGSLSVRSDSSTTSIRSFAFPVLQTEWNSSPVRMAKANRRQLQKHRRWRDSILCCRF